MIYSFQGLGFGVVGLVHSSLDFRLMFILGFSADIMHKAK